MVKNSEKPEKSKKYEVEEDENEDIEEDDPEKSKNKKLRGEDINDDEDDEFNEDDQEKTEEMIRYEKETGKYAIWRGIITEGFKKWKKGEKVYNRDKERISLYVSDETKNMWQDFIKESNYSTISRLIRDSVDAFISHKSEVNESINRLNPDTIANMSHALKEPLTSIKGYSQLLIENYKTELSNNVLDTIKNIFEQSILLENKIISFLDDIQVQTPEYDVLLVEDDLATIRLITSYFEGKGYACKGVASGSKGIEELRNATPKLILLDIILPDLSGYEICKTLKSDNVYKNIPVYFLTAISGSEVEKKMKETGANGYILKPFNFSDFDVIFDIIKKKKS
ncbi:MAG: response regulator [Candidatus Lokiarchaeota archaeon]|nr:response regulator [Candidatus Lokiarchaeota archaeon]